MLFPSIRFQTDIEARTIVGCFSANAGMSTMPVVIVHKFRKLRFQVDGGPKQHLVQVFTPDCSVLLRFPLCGVRSDARKLAIRHAQAYYGAGTVGAAPVEATLQCVV